jgi:hypothetical protein
MRRCRLPPEVADVRRFREAPGPAFAGPARSPSGPAWTATPVSLRSPVERPAPFKPNFAFNQSPFGGGNAMGLGLFRVYPLLHRFNAHLLVSASSDLVSPSGATSCLAIEPESLQANLVRSWPLETAPKVAHFRTAQALLFQVLCCLDSQKIGASRLIPRSSCRRGKE